MKKSYPATKIIRSSRHRHILAVLDVMAGRPGRYTVYWIPTSGGVRQPDEDDRRVKILGRELPLPYIRRTVGTLEARVLGMTVIKA